VSDAEGSNVAPTVVDPPFLLIEVALSGDTATVADGHSHLLLLDDVIRRGCGRISVRRWHGRPRPDGSEHAAHSCPPSGKLLGLVNVGRLLATGRDASPPAPSEGREGG
jgi:hypothetical protein